MQFDPGFVGENIEIGLNGAGRYTMPGGYDGGNSGYNHGNPPGSAYRGYQENFNPNPNFGPTYNYYDDHDDQ